MRPIGFGRLAWRIARKDWAESRGIVLGLTGVLFVPALLYRFMPGSEAFVNGFLICALVGAGFGYAQYCFMSEREGGTLDLLLGLPVGPRRLVLAKYASLYSMVLVTVNLPGAVMSDLELLYVINAAALTMATMFMAATVISDRPWAAQVPIYVILIVVLPGERLIRSDPGVRRIFEDLIARPLLLSTAALAVAAVLLAASVLAFGREQGRLARK